MSNRRKKKGLPYQMTYGSIRCPYCGNTVILRSADGIYKENKNSTELYVCSRYPECDAYVRVHPGTKKPMGTLADRKLRALRTTAHRYFDQLHHSGVMTKNEAYDWLASILYVPRSQAHIGYLGEYYCQLVIEKSRELLERRRELHGEQHLMRGGLSA